MVQLSPTNSHLLGKAKILNLRRLERLQKVSTPLHQVNLENQARINLDYKSVLLFHLKILMIQDLLILQP
jgi:hypothetical protein